MNFLIALLFSLSANAEMPRSDYEWVAASASNQKLGPEGGQGDVVEKLIIVPITTAAGDVWLHDGGGLSQKIFYTGTLADLKPITVELGARSVSGDWSVSTGANVKVLAVGRFK